MFSQQPRCHYGASPLSEVICQLRFPDILSISANPPAAFQEAIRDDYPEYTLRRDVPPPKVTGAPGHFSLENPPAVVNYQFASPDGVWRVNLTGNFISGQGQQFHRQHNEPRHDRHHTGSHHQIQN